MPRSWAQSIPTGAAQSGIIYNTRGLNDPRPVRLTLDVRRQITCPAARVAVTSERARLAGENAPEALACVGPTS